MDATDDTQPGERPNPSGPNSQAADLRRGTWFQAAVSGLWYSNAEACGTVSVVMIEGVTFSLSKTANNCRGCRFWSDVIPKTDKSRPDERICLMSRKAGFGLYGQDGKAVITGPSFGCVAFIPKEPKP